MEDENDYLTKLRQYDSRKNKLLCSSMILRNITAFHCFMYINTKLMWMIRIVDWIEPFTTERPESKKDFIKHQFVLQKVYQDQIEIPL